MTPDTQLPWAKHSSAAYGMSKRICTVCATALMTTLLSTAISTPSFLVLQRFLYYSVTFELVQFFLGLSFSPQGHTITNPTKCTSSYEYREEQKMLPPLLQMQSWSEGHGKRGRYAFPKSIFFSHVSQFKEIEIHSHSFHFLAPLSSTQQCSDFLHTEALQSAAQSGIIIMQ